MAAITVNLPRLYPLQTAIKRSPAKRKVTATGRRTGKTTLAGDIAIDDGLLRGLKVLFCSTSQDQTDIFWKRVTTALAPLNDHLYKNETKRVIEFNGGRIRAKTGRNPDVLRGEDADILILDECAFLDPAAWFEVGAPMLLDRDGVAYFFSTPNRKNWFYLLYERAKADTSGRWAAWNFATTENPHLSREALDEIAADMTDEAYRQEILGQFLESGGEVFRNVQARALAERGVYIPEHTYILGLDWAQKSDYTVITVMDASTRTMVDVDRFNGVSWALQRGRVMAMCAKWKPQLIIAESNSIGSPNIEALQSEGLRVFPFETTAVSKPPLIESLALAFERSEITILDDGVVTGELAAYERKVSAVTGRSQYSAPEGLHDDCVMSLALAWYGCLHSGARMDFVRSEPPKVSADEAFNASVDVVIEYLNDAESLVFNG